METTKENYIFKINNVLLSAFADKKSLSKVLKAENDLLSDKAEAELVEEYNRIKSGGKFELNPQDEPDLIKALSFATSSQYAKAFGEFLRLYKKNPNDLELMKNISSVLLRLKAQGVILKHFVPVFCL
jgi:hypothetical protein